MPSIEIVCVDQKAPTRFAHLPVALRAGKTLNSHRHPSHFQRDFNDMKGCIYHLGCPHLKRSRNGAFEAFDLLSKKCCAQQSPVFLKFKRVYEPVIRKLMNTLLQKSPCGTIIFTSDYQFSANRPRRVERIAISGFWKLYSEQQVRFNALYQISCAPMLQGINIKRSTHDVAGE